jgi:hypothetical protein
LRHVAPLIAPGWAKPQGFQCYLSRATLPGLPRSRPWLAS